MKTFLLLVIMKKFSLSTSFCEAFTLNWTCSQSSGLYSRTIYSIHLILYKFHPFLCQLLESPITKIEVLPKHHIESLKDVMQPFYLQAC